ncbi:AbrB/MazE/SpoVT family DNA-binding domain-containing protein [Halorhabdus amylolytica]|uniref:AbrB/MazE/SpoVT family DNA-binding domain-containing protein n=1 Tax=Halorhabdus amylolytica TaxID=2559573 RepID=UPI0010AB2F0A|nr:phosphate uptake regulator PhoU [Halorhabdus amylolytica]
METRKIQRVGGSTFTVSLPKDWARKQGLESGEEVRLYTHRDGSLIVRGRQADGGRLQSISRSLPDRTPETVERAIRSAYEAGFERITLVAETAITDEQSRAARSVARGLVGMDIVESGDEAVVVRAMLDPSAVSIRQSIEQAVSIVSSMLRTTIDGLADDAAVASHVSDRRPDVDRLLALIRRHYNRSLVSFGELDSLGVDRVALSRHHRTANRIERSATATIHLATVLDDVTLSARQCDAVADRLNSYRSALEHATKHVSDAHDGAVIPADESARQPVANPSEGEASLARIDDALDRLDDHVRAIERISAQPSVTGDTDP